MTQTRPLIRTHTPEALNETQDTKLMKSECSKTTAGVQTGEKVSSTDSAGIQAVDYEATARGASQCGGEPCRIRQLPRQNLVGPQTVQHGQGTVVEFVT